MEVDYWEQIGKIDRFPSNKIVVLTSVDFFHVPLKGGARAPCAPPLDTRLPAWGGGC